MYGLDSCTFHFHYIIYANHSSKQEQIVIKPWICLHEVSNKVEENPIKFNICYRELTIIDSLVHFFLTVQSTYSATTELGLTGSTFGLVEQHYTSKPKILFN